MFLLVVPVSAIHVAVTKPKPSIMIVSAVFGESDKDIQLRPLPQGVNAVMYTDRKFVNKSGWSVVNRKYHADRKGPWAENSRVGRYSWYNISDDGLRGVMAAKFYKMNAHLLPELQGYDMIMWLDAHFLHSDSPLSAVLPHEVRSLLKHHVMAVTPHQYRATVRYEVPFAANAAVKSTGVKAVHGDPQMAFNHQRKEGFKDDQGLYWCGFFVYRAQSSKVREAFAAWWREVQTYTFRDQLSFPYIAQIYGLQLRKPKVERVWPLISAVPLTKPKFRRAQQGVKHGMILGD